MQVSSLHTKSGLVNMGAHMLLFVNVLPKVSSLLKHRRQHWTLPLAEDSFASRYNRENLHRLDDVSKERKTTAHSCQMS